MAQVKITQVKIHSQLKDIYYLDTTTNQLLCRTIRDEIPIPSIGGHPAFTLEAKDETKVVTKAGVLHYLWKVNRAGATRFEDRFATLCYKLGLNHHSF